MGSDAPTLRVGQTAVARVLQATGTGQGMLSIAGRAVQAQLPPGVQAGQRLTVSVREVTPQQVVLELVKAEVKADAQTASRGQLITRLAGEAILVRDAAAFAAALQLTRQEPQRTGQTSRGGAYTPVQPAGEPPAAAPAAAAQNPVQALQQQAPPQAAFMLELPGQRKVELDLDERAQGGRPLPAGAAARMVLHGKLLGPVELTLWLDPSSTRVRVTGDVGALTALREHQGLLEQALRSRLGRPASAQVAERPEGTVRPVDPEGFSRYG